MGVRDAVTTLFEVAAMLCLAIGLGLGAAGVVAGSVTPAAVGLVVAALVLGAESWLVARGGDG